MGKDISEQPFNTDQGNATQLSITSMYFFVQFKLLLLFN